jgi:hypothetical protein
VVPSRSRFVLKVGNFRSRSQFIAIAADMTKEGEIGKQSKGQRPFRRIDILINTVKDDAPVENRY